jgi:hypothetical protein
VITNINLRVSAADSAEKSPLLEQLARKADANHDGTLTSAEFTAFLSTLTKSLDDDGKQPAAERPGDPSTNVHASVALPALARPTTPAVAIEALRRAITRTEGE